MRPCDICGEPGIIDGCCYDHAKACVKCDEPHNNEGDMCTTCAAQEEGAEFERLSNTM